MATNLRRVLLVDDDPEVVRVLTDALVQEGYEALTATEGDTAIDVVRGEQLDCVLLDIALGQSAAAARGSDDGIEVLKKIREESKVPVIMLTGTDVEVVKVVALNLGADDYVTKPFGAREVVARVGAVLRRTGTASADRVSYLGGRLVIERGTRQVQKDGKLIELTPSEFDLLDILAASPGLALSRKRLLDKLRSTSYFGEERVIDVHIRHLRSKIEDDASSPTIVVTVRGVGYRIGIEPD